MELSRARAAASLARLSLVPAPGGDVGDAVEGWEGIGRNREEEKRGRKEWGGRNGEEGIRRKKEEIGGNKTKGKEGICRNTRE